MFQSINILIICGLVLYSCGVVHANPQASTIPLTYNIKNCSDCVLIHTCQGALKLAKTKTPESNLKFKNAFCGFETTEPKICCSEFSVTMDDVENHPNVALLPKDRGDIEMMDGVHIAGGRVLNDTLLTPDNIINKDLDPHASTIPFTYNIKDCSDCVLIHTCQGALKLAKTKTPESNLKFKNAFCGFESSAEPKVCCSDFPEVSDEIKNHPNVALLPKDCGDIEGSRVVGGRVPKLYEFPWMALISYITREGLQFQCGGSVISSKYVLTAAHCVVPTKKIAGVRIGEFDILSRNDCQGDQYNSICESNLQDMHVDNVIIHPSYQGEPPEPYDIALIRLQTPIDFSYKNAGPICLPVPMKLRNVELGGKYATVAGWGATEIDTTSSVLLKVDIPIKTGEECLKYYKYSGPGTDSTVTPLCAGEYRKDSCSGDSGGPMMIEAEYDGVYRMIQYGIVSYGPRRCGSTYPGVYTDVTKFVKWILDTIKP